ncbi:MAG: hypothetical protein OEU36_22910 [Gammaproteobacteria bacterium]|nr:hypothetical protein [Gammaproteobacteria bacterium]
MKLCTLLVAGAFVVGISATAHAGSYGYGHGKGYGYGKYGHGYSYGGYKYRQRYYGKGHYGKGYYGKGHYGKGYYGKGYYGKSNSSGYLLGGLIVGGAIGYLIGRDYYYRRSAPTYYGYDAYPQRVYPAPRTYYQSSTSPTLGPAYAKGTHKERIVQTLDGGCFLVSTEEGGGETRHQIPRSDCY